MQQAVAQFEQAANDLALQLLDIFDVRAAAFVSLLLLVTLAVVSAALRRRIPTIEETLKGVLAILSGLACVPIACVFLLTTPPAIEKLSEDTRALVGPICVVVVGYLSVAELRSVFFRRRPGRSSGVDER